MEEIKQNKTVNIIAWSICAIILFIGVTFLAFQFGKLDGYTEGANKGIEVGQKEGYQSGYYSGQVQGISQGKYTATNEFVGCLNRCNSGTGIVNQCYSLNCINSCINKI